MRLRFAGEEDLVKRSTIENVQEQSVALGKKAIGLAASGAISLLNTIEQVGPCAIGMQQRHGHRRGVLAAQRHKILYHSLS